MCKSWNLKKNYIYLYQILMNRLKVCIHWNNYIHTCRASVVMNFDENVFILHCCNIFFNVKVKTCTLFHFFFILDVFLKQNADKKAFENFEKNVKSANVQANPKEGVVSERFESKYMVWRVKCISVLKKMYCTCTFQC